MISEKDKKGMEKWLSECENPKTKQKIQLLRNDENFLHDINALKKKQKDSIKEASESIKKLENIFDKALERAFLKKEYPAKMTKVEKKKLPNLVKVFQSDFFTGKKFNKDIVSLCRKYKLYPIDFWYYSLVFYILTDDFMQPNLWAGRRLENKISFEEFLKLPKNMNFDFEIRLNKQTKEQELFIKIFESTSLHDLKKNWKIINALQKWLKKEKGIGKRYYPRKNVKKEKQSIELDKTNLSDWEKQEKIYGEIKSSDFGPEEKKRKTRLKVMRHRYKKRFAE